LIQSRSGASRRLVGGLLAALLAVAGFALTAPAAGADTVDRVEDACGRIAGLTRYGTAGDAANAYDMQVGGTDTAIVANGRNYPDALAASALARDINAPIVLVEPPDGQDNVPLETQAALDEIGVSNIVIVGGTAAVSEAVEASLEERYGNATRVAGLDRYESAADIAREVGDAGTHDGLRTAVIARGDEFPDALAGGPLAYNGDGTTPFPLLLTRPNEVPAETSAALDELNIEQVIVLGGSAAVGPEVRAQLAAETGNPVIPLEGTNRYETAVDVAEFLRDELGFPIDSVFIARGNLFPDALTGGPLAGAARAPILLTTPDALHPATEAFLEENEGTIIQVIALGGTAAVETETLEAACEAATVPLEGPPGEPAPDQGAATALELSPDTETNALGTDHTVTATVTDAEGDPAAEGTNVRFEVYQRNSSTSHTFLEGGVDTATNGTADFTYTGPTTAEREDLIVSCVVEQQSQSCLTSGSAPTVDPVTGEFTNLREPGDTAGKVWARAQAEALTLTPDTDINATGEPHLVTATVTDQFGEPVVGETLLFQVFRDTDNNGLFQFVGDTDDNATNASGQVTFRYSSTETGTDNIVACVAGTTCTSTPTAGGAAGTSPNNQTTTGAAGLGAGPEAAINVTADPADQVAKEWISSTPERTFDQADADAQDRDFSGTVLSCNPGGAGDGGSVTLRTDDNRVFTVNYEPDDTFIVDGTQRTETGFEADCSAGDDIDIQFRPFGTSTLSLTNQPAPTTPA
jgi:putative cell wall-binding protein